MKFTAPIAIPTTKMPASAFFEYRSSNANIGLTTTMSTKLNHFAIEPVNAVSKTRTA